MNNRTPSWLLLILAGTCSAAATAAVGRLILDRLLRGTPVAVVPAVVEMGDHESGAPANGRIAVANSGTAALMLDKFATTCSCAAVEMEVGGQLRRAEVVRVAPGEQIDLIARVVVGGRVGTVQRVYVSFATNDPQAEQAIVELVVGRIKGGVVTSPLAVVLGEQPVGAAFKQLVRVYDNGATGRRLSAVRSLNPDRFSATLVAASDEEEDDRERGTLIGIIEVVPATGRAGPLDGRIEIRVSDEDRPPDYVEVLGQMVGPVVTRPDSIVLPRAVGGKSLYEGRVSVSARDGSPVAVTANPVPAGWSVSVADDPETPGSRTVLVSGSPTSSPTGAPLAGAPLVVRLSVTLTGGQVETIDIPVLVRREDP